MDVSLAGPIASAGAAAAGRRHPTPQADRQLAWPLFETPESAGCLAMRILSAVIGSHRNEMDGACRFDRRRHAARLCACNALTPHLTIAQTTAHGLLLASWPCA